MEDNLYRISGTYFQKESYHQFDLDCTGLLALSNVLGSIVVQKKVGKIEIGTGILIIRRGNEIGIAEYGNGQIEWATNVVDIIKLSIALAKIASMHNDNQDFMDHLHLEPVYLVSSDTVSDIVFQLVYTEGEPV